MPDSNSFDCIVVGGGVSVGVAAARLAGLRDLERHDGATFTDWLGSAARGANRRALWDLLCVATCNLPAAELSATVGAFVVREGFLRAGAAAVGVPAVGLSRLLEPAADLLGRSGGPMRPGTAADALPPDAGRAARLRTPTGQQPRPPPPPHPPPAHAPPGPRRRFPGLRGQPPAGLLPPLPPAQPARPRGDGGLLTERRHQPRPPLRRRHPRPSPPPPPPRSAPLP